MLSNDDGTFSLQIYLAGSKPDMVATADFDGDGMTDIAVGSPVDVVPFGPGRVSILLNKGVALPITPPPGIDLDAGDVTPPTADVQRPESSVGSTHDGSVMPVFKVVRPAARYSNVSTAAAVDDLFAAPLSLDLI